MLALAGGGAAALATAGGAALLFGVFGGEEDPVRRENVQGNPAATGGAVPSAPAPAWTFNAPQAIESGMLALLGGTLAWWSHDGETALGVDPATGAQRWRGQVTVPADESGSPKWLGVFGSTLFAAVGLDILYGLDQNGKQTFSHPVPETADREGDSVHGVHAVGGGVMLLDALGTILAMDMAGGRVLWRRKTKFANMNAIVTDGRRVYLQDATTTLALDPRSGRVLWSTPGTGRDGVNPGLAVADGMLMLATTSLTGIDAATGARRWTAVKQSTSISRPTAGGRQFFVEDSNDRIWALDARSGKPAWNAQSPLPLDVASVNTVRTPGIAVSEQLVVVPLYAPYAGFIVFRRSDGKALWAHKLSNGSTLKPWAVTVSGTTVYAASETILHAFKTKA